MVGEVYPQSGTINKQSKNEMDQKCDYIVPAPERTQDTDGYI